MHETIDWIRNPDLAPIGFKDSLVFVSAVTAIFEQARVERTNSALVRDLLTYLLLRRNPATGVEVPLEHLHPGYIGEDPIDVATLKASVKRSLELYVDGKSSQPYSVLMLLQRMHSHQLSNWVHPEEFTLLVLSAWLFTRQLDTEDISTQRACLNLYFDTKAISERGREREFMNSDTRIGPWLNEQIERIAFVSPSRADFEREISYVCSFASLIRASRMCDRSHPLKGVLRNEIAWLQQKTTLN